MNTKLVKEEMSMLLENMNEQFEMLNQHNSGIPQIELDIFMRNIQKLYENTIYLSKINHSNNHLEKTEEKENTTSVLQEEQQKTEPPTELVKEEPMEMIIEEKEKSEESIENEPATIQDQKVEQEEQVQQEVVAEEEQELELQIIMDEDLDKEIEVSEMVSQERHKEMHVENSVKNEEPESTKETQSEPALNFDDLIENQLPEADLFSITNSSSEIQDLNKKLAEARNTQSIVEKLQNKRIESLKTVIGINDKFYFINELFSGNTQKYEDIIYTLNNFKKLEDALVYFSTLKYKFGWDEESEAYEKLSQMLERKFESVNV